MSDLKVFCLECIPMPPSCYALAEDSQGLTVKNDGRGSLSSQSSSSELSSEETESLPCAEDAQEGNRLERHEQREPGAVVIENFFPIDDDPRLRMIEEVLVELRNTDNILVTEIGKRNIVSFLKRMITANAILRNRDESKIHYFRCKNCCECSNWDFEDDRGFHYLMEVFQANMLYFLTFRYHELERGRCIGRSRNSIDLVPNECWGERSVVEDFVSIFSKAASSRFFPSRNCVADCYCRDIGNCRPDQIPLSTKIRRSIVRLHRRAGVYLPHSESTEQGESYWIAIWWTCTCLLIWGLEPCIEITRLLDNKFCRQQYMCDEYFLSDHSEEPPTKRIRTFKCTIGHHPESYSAKISLDLLCREIRKIGLPFDAALMHDGPWTMEDKDDHDYEEGESMASCDSDCDSLKC